jgi:hypothetical protein
MRRIAPPPYRGRPDTHAGPKSSGDRHISTISSHLHSSRLKLPGRPEQTSASAQEIASSAAELARTAELLESAVQRFKVAV